ncbi:Protein of unknown function [Micromonospora lupini str. Lupac 08]|uniref:Uncharacterized protein n=1 Tax=Micromonospora lupini str. Lupac 08 TaxID=1150864 RepID=I0LC98_9ACTN|nr:Protein of unknown function [Micromonospora lupini str. Lupac 08]
MSRSGSIRSLRRALSGKIDLPTICPQPLVIG